MSTRRFHNIPVEKAFASYRFRGHPQATVLGEIQLRILQHANDLITARRLGMTAQWEAGAMHALIALKRDLRRGYSL